MKKKNEEMQYRQRRTPSLRRSMRSRDESSGVPRASESQSLTSAEACGEYFASRRRERSRSRDETEAMIV